MISISYAIMACNEHDELETLLNKLNDSINKELDEVVLLLDEHNYTQKVYDVASKFDYIKIYKNPLNKD